jgi:hypothetical protein
MHPYTLQELARERHADFHREASGRRLARIVRGRSSHASEREIGEFFADLGSSLRGALVVWRARTRLSPA